MSFDKKLFVGIDTSNYTTSLALADGEGNIIANLKKLLPVGEGERGLRQSDAVFAHIKNIRPMLKELGELIGGREISAIGVSTRPRDVQGSYMPCFLVGETVAASFSASCGAPVYDFSHQSGHIMAALYSSGATDILETSLFGAFHVSGGTTEILLVRPGKCGFEAELAGGTLDLNCGQAIDRVGVKLGLSFPCGREMEELALLNCQRVEKTRLSVKGLGCNLSGLENKALKLIEEGFDKSYVCAYVFDFIGRTLAELTNELTDAYGEIPLVYAGGVMSNSIIKNMLKKRKNTFFAEPVFSSDNASGAALLSRMRYLAERKNEDGSL